MDKLERQLLVERRACADKRAVALVLTERGNRRMRSILRARRECLETIFRALSVQEQGQLTRSVEVMLASITTSDQVAESICRLCEESACPQRRCPVTQALHA